MERLLNILTFFFSMPKRKKTETEIIVMTVVSVIVGILAALIALSVMPDFPIAAFVIGIVVGLLAFSKLT